MTLQDYIWALQDAEYNRSAGVIMRGVSQITRMPGELQTSLAELDKAAKALDVINMDTPELSEALAVFRAKMNATETLVKQYALAVEVGGGKVAKRSTTAKLFYGTSQDLIDQGVDPVSAEAYSYFMGIVKDMNLGYIAPDPSSLVKHYSESDAFIERMNKWGDGYADVVNNSVQRGIAEGWNPKKIARYIRKTATDLPINAAYTVTKTLQFQSYRDASAEMERLNGRFIEKKIRMAALDGNTCAACIALHGTEVPKGESIKDHYNGRCDAIYVPAGGDMPEFMQTFGEPGERNFVPFQDGESWFAQQSEAFQRQTLGPGKYEWYKQNRSLQGLIGNYSDSVFGDMPVVKPLWVLDKTAIQNVNLPDYYTDKFREYINDDANDLVLVHGHHYPSNWSKDKISEYEKQLVLGHYDDARQMIDDWVKQELISDNPRISIRTSEKGLKGIAKDGRYKSQFESGTSRGLYSPGRRKEAEKNLFNTPINIDKSKRPIYGMINYGDNVATGYQYGEFEIVLKNDVLERTTITLGDSLNVDRWDRKASPFYDPSIGSQLGEETKYGINLIERVKSGQAGGISYIEAQIHKGLTVDDIDSIIVDNAGMIPLLNGLFSDTTIKFIIRKGT